MIDRLLLPEPLVVPELYPHPPGKGPRGDFMDWLQAQEPTPVSRSSELALPDGSHLPRVVEPSIHREPPLGDQMASDFAPANLPGVSLMRGAAAPVVIQVELEFVRGDGRRETLPVPMRLAATGRMAWASTHSFGRIPSAGSGDHPFFQNAVTQRPPVAQPIAEAERSVGDRTAQVLPPHRVAGERSDHANGDTADVSPTHAWLTAAAELWLERLIRWTQRQGHDPVAWVRDYRLDDSGARDLTRSLRSRAHAGGFELARIVVNGRELWRAPSHPDSSEIS